MTFTTLHIVLTAATVAVLTFAVGLLAGAAVFLWRLSANKPDLNDDGLPGFSANDWAAPILTYLILSVYADLRPPADPARYRQVRALAFGIAVAVNVITI